MRDQPQGLGHSRLCRNAHQALAEEAGQYADANARCDCRALGFELSQADIGFSPGEPLQPPSCGQIELVGPADQACAIKIRFHADCSVESQRHRSHSLARQGALFRRHRTQRNVGIPTGNTNGPNACQ